MLKIKMANLYAEKYDKTNLLLDFISKDEFFYFAFNGDYYPEKKCNIQDFNTMLLLLNIPDIKVSEGDIISVPMDKLIRAKEMSNKQNYDNSGLFFIVFDDSSWFNYLITEKIAYKNNKIYKDYSYTIHETWASGTPCALKYLDDSITVDVLDVGQGNTNLIYSHNKNYLYPLTIFDFGKDAFSSNQELQNTFEEIRNKIKEAYPMTLILSHWDLDHYNLLAVADDVFLQNLCCVFLPSEVISLTAKKVATAIEKNCKHIKTFSPFKRTSKGYIKLLTIINESKYTLFLGEKSKDKNKSGLALLVNTKNEATILSADHSNKQIWTDVFEKVINKGVKRLNIVIPHHGGNCGSIDLDSLPISPNIAAISVGKNNYKHPNQHTIDTYLDFGFNVKRTDWERDSIIIKMT